MVSKLFMVVALVIGLGLPATAEANGRYRGTRVRTFRVVPKSRVRRLQRAIRPRDVRRLAGTSRQRRATKNPLRRQVKTLRAPAGEGTATTPTAPESGTPAPAEPKP
jgi:hypothetical protein